MKRSVHRTVDKLRAYSRLGGFTFVGVAADPPRIIIRPNGGDEVQLTTREAEIYLSGFVTGRRSITERSPSSVSAERSVELEVQASTELRRDALRWPAGHSPARAGLLDAREAARR